MGSPLPPPMATTLGPPLNTLSTYNESRKRPGLRRSQIMARELTSPETATPVAATPTPMNTPALTAGEASRRLSRPITEWTLGPREISRANTIPKLMAARPMSPRASHLFNESPGMRSISAELAAGCLSSRLPIFLMRLARRPAR